MRDTKTREQKQLSKRYHRMFSALVFGTLFLVNVLIGLNVSRRYMRRADSRWEDGPIVWQVVLGTAMVGLGIYWSRRLDDPRTRVKSGVSPRVRNVGSGRSKGAAQARRRRLEPESDR